MAHLFFFCLCLGVIVGHHILCVVKVVVIIKLFAVVSCFHNHNLFVPLAIKMVCLNCVFHSLVNFLEYGVFRISGIYDFFKLKAVSFKYFLMFCVYHKIVVSHI